MLDSVVGKAQQHLQAGGLDGWLLYDYRGMNPILWETLGHVDNVTRPCWFWVPSEGEPTLLVSYVDLGRFAHLGIATQQFVSRREMVAKLREVLPGSGRIAMEYSPEGALPRVSKVDGGTLELVRGLGLEVVSSANTLQAATQTWNAAQLDSHLTAAKKLTAIVGEAFRHIGDRLNSAPTEHDVAEFIRGRFVEEGLVVTDGPVVAVNEHSSDPHFEPDPGNASPIREGDWLLIDLWARTDEPDSMFADITWTAYVGRDVPQRHRDVFQAVIGGRDAALEAIRQAFNDGRVLQGWEVDKVAREHITALGFGQYFNHRLGHSLGREVHSNAVNLDGWETNDTRQLIPGIAVTIEPGIYLPEFGVRSEIDVYLDESGPRVTTDIQTEVVKID